MLCLKAGISTISDIYCVNVIGINMGEAKRILSTKLTQLKITKDMGVSGGKSCMER